MLVYDERGLLPCIAQDAQSGEVLMLAYVNEEAVSLTQSTGQLHLFSRSRESIWRKGESSGNTLAVQALRVDCDGDALLALVSPAGPACHTGRRTCFHRGEMQAVPAEALPRLQRTLQSRALQRPPGSYTVELLDDPPRIGEKVQEEAEEVARAARQETDLRVDEESADLLYHLLVLMTGRGRRLADACAILLQRARGRSG